MPRRRTVLLSEAKDLAASERAPELAGHLQYLEVERRLAPRTLAMYGDAFTKLQAFATKAGVDLRAVEPAHVRHFAAQLHSRGLGARSIAIALAAWRGFYRRLGEEGRVKQNPVDGVRAPKAAKPLPKALAVDHAVALAAHRNKLPAPASGNARDAHHHRRSAALEARDACITELLYGSGLRVGELVGLDARPSSEAAGWIDAGDAAAHVLGKGSKRRSVPVGRKTLEALAAWHAARGDVARAGESALFVSARGTRLTPSQVRSRLKSRAIAAGVPSHVHPHMLRHSFASHVLQSSGDLRAVQELLGHANIATTQVYTRLDFGHLSKVYDAAHPRARRKP